MTHISEEDQTQNKEDSYRPPSSFFYEMRNNESRTKCTKTKCYLCIITTGICVGGTFLVKYLIDNWSVFEDIS